MWRSSIWRETIFTTEISEALMFCKMRALLIRWLIYNKTCSHRSKQQRYEICRKRDASTTSSQPDPKNILAMFEDSPKLWRKVALWTRHVFRFGRVFSVPVWFRTMQMLPNNLIPFFCYMKSSCKAQRQRKRRQPTNKTVALPVRFAVDLQHFHTYLRWMNANACVRFRCATRNALILHIQIYSWVLAHGPLRRSTDEARV